MWMRIGIAAAVAAFAVAIYLEFGLDIRTPRSSTVIAGVVGAQYRVLTKSYTAVSQAMTVEYGPAAKTFIAGRGAVTMLDGEIVARAPLQLRFLGAIGLTLIEKTPGTIDTFPFRVSPEYLPKPEDIDTLSATIHRRYEGKIRGRYLDFTRADNSIGPCWNFSVAELNLPIAGRLLALGRTTLCTVTWKRVPLRHLLVGVTIADGGSWIRPFARGACRVLANAWLEKSGAMHGAERPDYLQCILADRPDRGKHSMSTDVYEVRSDDTLALIE
jgi:hypothetical protein